MVMYMPWISFFLTPWGDKVFETLCREEAAKPLKLLGNVWFFFLHFTRGGSFLTSAVIEFDRN